MTLVARQLLSLSLSLPPLGETIMAKPRDVVQEPLDVGIADPLGPLPMEFHHPPHGHRTVACRPETVGVVGEERRAERTQEEPPPLLSHAVADGGDPERSGFPVPLGNPDAAPGQGLESPAREFPHPDPHVLVAILLEQTNADLVDPRHPALPLDVAKSGAPQGLGDPSRQRRSLELDQTQVLSS